MEDDMTANNTPRRLEAAGGFWRDKTALVTGATGLVGSWLVKDLLKSGARVVALIRDWHAGSELVRSGDWQRVTAVFGSLEEYGTVARAISEHGVDTVFHLGAQTLVGVAHAAPLQTFESNIRGTYNLLEACRQHITRVRRLIVASSDKAYGESTLLPYTETHPLQGSQPYEVSKSCADLLTQSYWKTYRIPVAVVRCGNIYGGGDLNWSRIVPGTIQSLMRGERPVIRSDGQYVRDYLYVKDVVAGYRKLAETLSDNSGALGEGFNLSAEDPVTVKQIVAQITALMARDTLEPIVLNQASGEIRAQYLSAKKADRVLGWRAAFSLQEGLRETIVWYENYLSAEPSGLSMAWVR